MRVQHLLPTRPDPWDRNSTVVHNSNKETIGSGASAAQWTTRVTYTVPTNRKAFLDAYGTRSNTTTSAAGAGLHGSRVAVNNGTTTQPVVYVEHLESVVKDDSAYGSDGGFVPSGGQVLLQVEKTLASAAVVEHTQWFKCTEYDAR